MTFVEEALALALAPDPAAAERVRRLLAYAHPEAPRWEERRHFMLASWVPENVAAGRLVDRTADLPGAEPRLLEVSPATWAAWADRHAFDLPPERRPVGRHPFHVLPVEVVAAHPERVPEGAILLVAREPSPHLPYAVTHVALRLPGDPPRIRHASRRGHGRVRDEDLADAARRMSAWNRWPVAGFIVLEARPSSAWDSRPRAEPR